MSVTEAPLEALAHCSDALCVGHEQQKIAGVRTTVVETIGERGGSEPFVGIVENSRDYLRFADPEDVACPECGRDREVTDQVRPTYQSLMGPPDALLRARKAGLSAPGDVEALLAAAKAAQARPESPREMLDRRFVSGEIEDAEYFSKRAVLDGTTTSPAGGTAKPQGGARKAA